MSVKLATPTRPLAASVAASIFVVATVGNPGWGGVAGRCRARGDAGHGVTQDITLVVSVQPVEAHATDAYLS